MNSDILTIPETTERLRVGRTAIYNAFKSGQLRKRKVCGRTFVTAASILAFEAALEAFEEVKIPDGGDRRAA
jgi:hypothetical protein